MFNETHVLSHSATDLYTSPCFQVAGWVNTSACGGARAQHPSAPEVSAATGQDA